VAGSSVFARAMRLETTTTLTFQSSDFVALHTSNPLTQLLFHIVEQPFTDASGRKARRMGICRH